MRLRRRFSRPNPLTGSEDLGLAFLGVTVLGLVGYAIYSKSRASTSGVAATNPFINAPQTPASQAAYAGTAAGIAAAQGQPTYGNTGDN